MVPHDAESIITKFALASLLMLLVSVPGGTADTVSYSLPHSVQQRIDLRPATVPHHDDLYDNDTSPLKIADGGERWAICGAWTATSNTLYFHVVFALLFFAFLAPANNFGMIWLRAAVVCASLVMFYSAWFLECDQEKFIWAALIFFVNFVYLTISLIKLRPVKFDKEIECVYMSLFEPLHVSRLRFKKILQCMKTVRVLKYQEVYAQEKVTKVDSLSLVLTGKLVVSQNQKALHIVFPHQFLDSPEWFGVSTDDFFQVSIVAMEESRVLLWHRDKLKLSIMGDPFLQTVIDHILGRDVVKKLMQVTQVNETMAQSNGFIISEVDEEDKPMLITNNHIMSNHHHNGKSNGGKNENNVSSLSSSSSSSSSSSPGITALINRQLQAADVNAWRLGRIEETDHETPV